MRINDDSLHSNFVRTILVDARCLQDADYRFRGVGQHSACILRTLRETSLGDRRPRLVAILDPQRDSLHEDHAYLFDEQITVARRLGEEPTWFIELSPMTHDPTWVSNLLMDPSIYKITLFYDLIQLLFPDRYLHPTNTRIIFMSCLAWLTKYDTFAAISDYTANNLMKTIKVVTDRVFVSGVAVRPALEPLPSDQPVSFEQRRYLLVAGGGDPRKNPECVLKAHARSTELRKAGIQLHIYGNYPSSMKEQMRKLYAEEGGSNTDLVFEGHLTDEEMRQLYRSALVTVVPSRAEGFSIPIVESSAADTPVIVSDAGAHPELVKTSALRFEADDHLQVQGILESLATNAHGWEAAREEQSSLWLNYTTQEVGRRFVSGIIFRQPEFLYKPSIRRNLRPKIAILTPYPPARSGVADYSAATLRPLAKFADLHLFTDSQGIRPDPAFKSMSAVQAARYTPKSFDAVVSVLGNSNHHLNVFHYLMDYGGAAIAHDARMIDFYFRLLGAERAISVATSEAGKPISLETASHWLDNQHELPVLFLSEVARAASPLIVHSPVTAHQIATLYGKKPVVLPFAQYRRVDLRYAEPQHRTKLRHDLEIMDEEVAICTFGFVSDDKAPDELIWTLKMLREWKISAKLIFCGEAHPLTGERLNKLSHELGLKAYITFCNEFTSEAIYTNYLFAADIGIQLRTYFMGGLSGALNDCIAAAMPTIANKHLAGAMEAPAFVRVIPDQCTPILIAEAVLEIIRSRDNVKRPVRAAQEFAEFRSAERYATMLMNTLGFDGKTKKDAA